VGWDPAAALFTLRGIRRQVVAPLNNLVAASERIEQGDFVPRPGYPLPNELGQFPRVQPYVGRAAIALSFWKPRLRKRRNIMKPTSSSTCCSMLSGAEYRPDRQPLLPAYFADCA
jgi:hypothetical protein